MRGSAARLDFILKDRIDGRIQQQRSAALGDPARKLGGGVKLPRFRPWIAENPPRSGCGDRDRRNPREPDPRGAAWAAGADAFP